LSFNLTFPPYLCAVGFILLANLIWSVVGIFIRFSSLSPSLFLIGMGIVIILVMLTFLAITGQLGLIREHGRRPAPILFGLLTGLLGYGIFSAYGDPGFFIAGANLILNSHGLLVIMLAPLLLKERSTPVEIICSVIGVSGLVLFIFGQPNDSGTMWTIGLLFATIALVCNVFTTLLSRSLAQWMPAILAPLWVGIGDLVVGLATLPFSGDAVINWSWFELILVTVVATTSVCLAFYFNITGFRLVKAQVGTILGLSQPILTAVWGVLIFQEYLNWVMISGGTVVLGAIAFQVIWKSRRIEQKA